MSLKCSGLVVQADTPTGVAIKQTGNTNTDWRCLTFAKQRAVGYHCGLGFVVDLYSVAKQRGTRVDIIEQVQIEADK